MTTNRENGLALFGEIYGPEMAQGVAAFAASGEGFGPKQAEWTLDFVFAQVWLREALDRRTRSAATLGMLIGLGARDEIKYHTKMGLKNGLTRQEMEEIFYTAIPYAGFPAANLAKAAMLEAFAELDAETPKP